MLFNNAALLQTIPKIPDQNMSLCAIKGHIMAIAIIIREKMMEIATIFQEKTRKEIFNSSLKSKAITILLLSSPVLLVTLRPLIKRTFFGTLCLFLPKLSVKNFAISVCLGFLLASIKISLTKYATPQDTVPIDEKIRTVFSCLREVYESNRKFYIDMSRKMELVESSIQELLSSLNTQPQFFYSEEAGAGSFCIVNVAPDGQHHEGESLDPTPKNGSLASDKGSEGPSSLSVSEEKDESLGTPK